ncbi:MAG: branched-chain amino acid ABC transporter substrate-binding protein [Actinomycetota bacterium]|nr:branched-chain amino acid ABC transporter substrate-binding protein [Actinomycetota bacterium]
MKRSRSFVFLALVMVLSLVAAACGGGDDPGPTAGPDEEINCNWTIGAMGAYSGAAAALGQRIVEGTQKAIDEANEAGEVPCTLEIQKEDSQGDPNQAPALADKLIENEELVFCACPYFSGETLATGAKFSQAGIGMSGTGTNETIDEQGFETWFRAVAPDNIQGEVAADYLANVLGAQSLAVVHDNQDYSKGIAEVVIEAAGPDVLATEDAFVIDPEETDYSAVVSKIKAANPDAIFYGGYYEEAGLLRKQLVENGVDVPFMSDDGALDPGFVESAGDAAEGVIWSCPCADPLKIEGASEWVQSMKDEFGPKAPGTFAADMYDVTNVAIEALKGLNGDEDIEEVRAAVVEFFKNAEGFEGIAKTYSWDDTGEFEGGPEDIWIYENKGGEIKSIGPAQELIGQAG